MSMRVTPLIISILVFSGVMLGISLYLGGIQSVYMPGGTANSTTFGAFNESFIKINSTMSSLHEKTAGIASDKPALLQYYDILLATVDVFGLMFQMPGIIISYVSLSLQFMVGSTPSWFLVMIPIVIITIFALKIVSVVTKTEEI